MAQINHRVGIKAKPEEIYKVLTTDKGLMSWWTNNVTGAVGEGSVITFMFGVVGLDFKVAELIPNKYVRWQHSGQMPEAWIGTEIVFEILQEENQTFLNFSHINWQEESDFMSHCNTKWAVFLLSLKDQTESGKGKPFPNDIQIDHS